MRAGAGACCSLKRGTPFWPSRSARPAALAAAQQSANPDGLRYGMPRTVRAIAPSTVQGERRGFNFSFTTDEQFDALRANGRQARACQDKDQDFDSLPVVKLFTPDAGATWLLTDRRGRAHLRLFRVAAHCAATPTS